MRRGVLHSSHGAIEYDMDSGDVLDVIVHDDRSHLLRASHVCVEQFRSAHGEPEDEMDIVRIGVVLRGAAPRGRDACLAYGRTKVMLRSRANANRILTAFAAYISRSREQRRDWQRLHVYQCAACGAYHVGHQEHANAWLVDRVASIRRRRKNA